MNTAIQSVLMLVLAVAAGAGTAVLLQPASSEPSAAGEVEGVLAGVQERLGRIEATQTELAEAVERARREASAARTEAPRLPIGEIEAVVARWLEERGEGTAAAQAAEAPEVAAAPSAEKGGGLTAESAFDLLRNGNGRNDDALWQRIREAGLTDEVIAMYEERAEDAPDDANAQVDLGQAYIQKIQEVGNGPQAGLWATKADQQFDRALELDPRHWEARYTKAVALSFWPPIFGKQGEAIRQFETLVQQQGGDPSKKHYASTYLLLGNMYQQIGNHEKAVAAWQNGLQVFPGDADLQKQLESFQ